MPSRKKVCTDNRPGSNMRVLCRGGTLLRAVRDIVHGIPDWRIKELILADEVAATPEQIDQVILLAHAGLVAGGQMQRSAADDRLPREQIPSIPR